MQKAKNSKTNNINANNANLLYQQNQVKDNCGFGLSVHIKGKDSHSLLSNSLAALSKMEHRGGISFDKKTGDGCGLLIKKPDSFFRDECKKLFGAELPSQYAVGVLFLPTEADKQQKIKNILDELLSASQLQLVGWRKVPVCESVLGEEGRSNMPSIWHCFLQGKQGQLDNMFLELFQLNRDLLNKINYSEFYIASLSEHLVSYKGMMIPVLLPEFYQDLANPEVTTSICLFHQRFATNTLPTWALSQPFSTLAHNGEINSISGNRNWAQARLGQLTSSSKLQAKHLQPVVNSDMSDSSSLDDMLQVLMAGGMSLIAAIRILIPPAWQARYKMDENISAFYQYHSLHMEPWDGPAGIVLTDGRYAVCTLDRHGLRPARWSLTDDDVVMLASEVGLHDKSKSVVQQGRIAPGSIVAIDTKEGKILTETDIDAYLSAQQSYVEWIKKYVVQLDEIEIKEKITFANFLVTDKDLPIYHKLFQYNKEEINFSLQELMLKGLEATSSMGDDIPIAILSQKQRLLTDYFRQQFSQVTNPPIDSIREAKSMSLTTEFDVQHSFFDYTKENDYKIIATSPVLTEQQFIKLINLGLHDTKHIKNNFNNFVLDLNYTKEQGLQQAIVALQEEAVKAVKAGAGFIVLSDCKQDKDKLILNSLLAVGAIHNKLIEAGLRFKTSIIVATGIMRDSHQLATLIGFGANAVYPYLAYATIKKIAKDNEIQPKQALENYKYGTDKALLKIMAKMGISCISSYRGSKLFEALGIDKEVVDLCFTGCPTPPIGGITFANLQQDDIASTKLAYSNNPVSNGGLIKYTYDGEFHCFNPNVVTSLIESVKLNSYSNYEKIYADPINKRVPAAIRDLFWLNKGKSIDVSEVEPIEAIMKRFDSAGMSLGALSPEAHETLAMAMNEIGGRSNSGEGGEDESRYGTNKNSKIKQIASGRFGVTPAYLNSADVLQIKIAQGAKPGEGGQLPGQKVNAMIAKLRYSKEGVTLISPPPHHDIYSIEDIAQLIYDLKQINSNALVSVKLVAEPGIGIIATGLTKAYVDLITISGHDGGTGASPLTSIRHAGSAWELGLTEVQQALRANNLRSKVLLQADGGLKTGLDIIKAAAMGAESFGFGTTALVAMGCKFIRVCHLNNCPTGVNTQNEELRKDHYQGEVDRVVNFFKFVAEETREWLAYLGLRSMEELIGRLEFLKVRTHDLHPKQQNLNLANLLIDDFVAADSPRTCQVKCNEAHDKGELAQEILADAIQSVEDVATIELPTNKKHYEIFNFNRSIGATLSGLISRKYGTKGMADKTITINLSGTAGQSLGVWNAVGVNINLIGNANDYVGKGMAGGNITISVAADAKFASQESSIIGNTCLYGATGGTLYANGMAGERFAVRNSGATAIIEGAGDHCCEYMTGGMVISLCKVGINFGAGMTGGTAFVMDASKEIMHTLNPDNIMAHDQLDKATLAMLQQEITKYQVATNSKHAATILQDFAKYSQHFVQIKPK